MPLSGSGFNARNGPESLASVRRFWYQGCISTDTSHLCTPEVDVVLMGVTSGVEPACAAIREAAAIVEAEWMRLRRPSVPVRYPNCELPAARRERRRTSTLVSIAPTRVRRSTPPRAADGRWPASLVWARQRSPPPCQRRSQSGERR
jgi:hypothetical protein